MTSPQAIPEPTASGAATVPLRFEVAVLPVADVDRAKAFYQGLGWRLDADFPIRRRTSGSCSSPRRARPPRSSSARA